MNETISDLVGRRNKLRFSGHYEEADIIRDRLELLGYDVKDTKNGTDVHLVDINKTRKLGEWLGWKKFQDRLLQAGIVDGRYPSGSLVWLPFGAKLRNYAIDAARDLMENMGFVECHFPALLSNEAFRIVSENITPLINKIFTVESVKSKDGFTLKPTSEAVVYPMFSQWLRDQG